MKKVVFAVTVALLSLFMFGCSSGAATSSSSASSSSTASSSTSSDRYFPKYTGSLNGSSASDVKAFHKYVLGHFAEAEKVTEGLISSGDSETLTSIGASFFNDEIYLGAIESDVPTQLMGPNALLKTAAENMYDAMNHYAKAVTAQSNGDAEEYESELAKGGESVEMATLDITDYNNAIARIS